jgi:hypothetical protein
MCTVFDSACSIDYASWWQAFGSIAAILFAGYIARSDERKKMSDTYKLTFLFLENYDHALDEIIEVCRTRNRQRYQFIKENFDLILDQSNQIDLRYLPFEAATAIIHCRHKLVEVKSHLKSVPTISPLNWQSLGDKIAEFRQDLAAATRTVYNVLTSKWWKWNRMHD